MEYTNSQITALIEEHIHNQVHRKMLYRRLVDGVCFEPLAEEFNMSVRGVKKIVYKAEKKLFQKIP